MLTEGGQAGLVFYDAAGEILVALGEDDDGRPTLRLFDREGKILFEAPVHESPPAVP